MKVERLSRRKADEIMKSLEGDCFRNFKAAFHCERMYVDQRDRPWALPEEERSYFLVESYLFGLHIEKSPWLSLSSFARVLSKHPKQKCAMCLKSFLEQELFPMLESLQKSHVNANLTEAGKVVFEELRNLRSGVHRVEVKEFDGYYYPATITYSLASTSWGSRVMRTIVETFKRWQRVVRLTRHNGMLWRGRKRGLAAC